ncbi:MAG TPA: DUF922 domain-containing protein [Vicinamibacterales bacterium]|jgi:hypothetical protein|nr:DUF922 domain-containing protein [Vicinamibacterales bacterium]
MRASPCGVVIVLAVCCGARAHAQSQKSDLPLVEWSTGRRLAVKDFKGRIPARAPEASLSWVAIEAAWECREGKASAQARAVFDPNRSWWRDPVPNLWQNVDDASLLPRRDDGGRSLLAHEQLHFDMTEVWARRIREKFKALPSFCRTPGGPGEFEKAIGDMEREWQEEQQRYDKETGHGTDAARQRSWAQNVTKALRESDPAAGR